DMQLEPALATDWRQVDDLTWEFDLRPGVVFHNGKPFTAEAVKYSLERYFDPEVQSTSPFPKNVPLDRIEIVDDLTVRIITQEPSPILPELLVEYAWIVEPEHYSSNSLAYLAEHPVRTGPYMLESWQRDAQTVMVAFEDHWRGKPAIDRIIWRVILNDGTRLAELQAGTVDIITNLPPDLADDIDAREGLR